MHTHIHTITHTRTHARTHTHTHTLMYVPATSSIQMCQLINTACLYVHCVHIIAYQTFHTETEETVCRFTEPEPYPELETVSAALAGGPIGPGDSVSQMNKTLILSTCMSNGLLLKATRPAMSLDATFINRAFGGGGADGKLWASYTVVGRTPSPLRAGHSLLA